MDCRLISAAVLACYSDPQLIDVKTVAATLGCSPRHVYRLADAGHMPRPLKVGSLVRWNREALIKWIERGCPKRG